MFGSGHSRICSSLWRPTVMRSMSCMLRRILFRSTVRMSAGQASVLAGDLLAFAQQKPADMRTVDLNKILRSMHDMLRMTVGRQSELQMRLWPEPNMVRADPALIEQVILQFVVNAVDAMPNGGHLTLETQRVTLTAEEAARLWPGPLSTDYVGQPFATLAVTDSGHGMTEEIRLRLFEPFFTTKDRARTTGLGLCTSYGIVRQHGGQIAVRSTPGQGSTFTVYLPVAAPVPAPPGRATGGSGPS
jgi:two-component system, cell cycle sensor histidine kinase and response regulator CckA